VLFLGRAIVDHPPMAEPPRIRRVKRGKLEVVRAIAGHQDGIVTRAQLLSAGVDRWGIDRALRTGRLHPIHRGVFSTQAPELAGEDALLIAALLAAGDRAVLSHGTAAWRWHIIPAPPTTIELAVPRDRRAPRGLRLFQGELRADDLTLNARFPSTSVPRTLLDLAARYDQRALLRALAEADSTTTPAPPTSKPPSAAAIPAAPTSEPRSTPTPPATANPRASSNAAFASS
jgi:hypothetical protein